MRITSVVGYIMLIAFAAALLALGYARDGADALLSVLVGIFIVAWVGTGMWLVMRD